MRFISKYRRYKLGAREDISMNLATGKSQVIQHGVLAEFQHGGLFGHEKELAKNVFQFKGTLQETDEATPVDPVYGVNSRVSVYDTDTPELVARWAQWDRLENKPEGTIKAEVEAKLLSDPMFGSDYVLVEVAKVLPPYSRYVEHRKVHGRRTVEHAVKDIQAAYELTGFDIDQAVAYERQENGPAEIIEALEALRAPAPVEELVEA